MMEFIDVMRAGNVFGDGEHDDTKALQACFDSAGEGGTVYFPDGTYLISAALIFYTGQRIRLGSGARLLRSAKTDPVTRYMLASYSDPSDDGYGGVHDVVISGGIFDGNAETDEFLTIINTVRCSDITVENATFLHGAGWHCIEFNSTRGAVVRGCVFDGTSYTRMRDNLTNELIQTDAPDVNSYGPVYNCDGTLIDFRMGKTPCRDVLIENNIFRCAGFPAVGHHGDHAHSDIVIRNNIFDGTCYTEGRTRGYITFMPQVSGVTVTGNVFISPDLPERIEDTFQIKNPDPAALFSADNTVIR